MAELIGTSGGAAGGVNEEEGPKEGLARNAANVEEARKRVKANEEVIDRRRREEVRGLGEELLRLDLQAQRSRSSKYRQISLDLQAQRGGSSRGKYCPAWMGVISDIVAVADRDLHEALQPYDDPILLEKHGEQLLDFVIRLASERQWDTWREFSVKASVSAGATNVFLRLFASYGDPVDERTLSKLLIIAAEEGSVEILSVIIAAGAGPLVPAAADVWSTFNALHYAAKNGHRRCVARLIESGALVDATHRMGGTALTEAIRGGHKGVAIELLAAGADVNKIHPRLGRCRPYVNFTPLCIAVVHSDEEMVKVLLEAGAAPSNGPTHGKPLRMAAQRGSYEIINSLLLAGASVSSVDNKGRSALHVACENNRQDAVDVLLRHNACVASLCNDGLSPMDVVGTAVVANRQGWFVPTRLNYGAATARPSTLNSAETSTVENICDLLESASAWGRRGWLVMMRSRPLARDISLVHEPSSNAAELCEEGCTAGALHEGGHARTDWRAAVVWLLQSPDESLFCNIVRYL